MAFKLNRASYSVILEKEFLLDNSQTFRVGQLVVPSAGGVVTPAPAAATNLLGVIVAFTGKDGSVLTDVGDTVNTPPDNTTTQKYWAKVALLSPEHTFLADFSASIATHNVFDTYSVSADGLTVDASSRVAPGDVGYPREVVLLEKVSDTVGLVKIRSRLV